MTLWKRQNNSDRKQISGDGGRLRRGLREILEVMEMSIMIIWCLRLFVPVKITELYAMKCEFLQCVNSLSLSLSPSLYIYL